MGRGAWQVIVHGVAKKSDTTEQLHFYFSNLDTFYFFFFCDWTSNTVLGRNGSSQHPCPVSKKAFSFLSQLAFIWLRYVSSVFTLVRVLWMLNFIQCFSCTY